MSAMRRWLERWCLGGEWPDVRGGCDGLVLDAGRWSRVESYGPEALDPSPSSSNAREITNSKQLPTHTTTVAAMNVAKSFLGTFKTASSIKSNCRKVMCIGRNYACANPPCPLPKSIHKSLTCANRAATMSQNSTTSAQSSPSSSSSPRAPFSSRMKAPCCDPRA